MLATTAVRKMLNVNVRVEDLWFDQEHDILLVEIQPVARTHRCPHCGFRTAGRYDQHERDWRHVPLGRWRVVLRGFVARLTCPKHGVVTERVAWAEPDARFTRDFEDLVAWVTRQMNKTAVVNLLRIAWETVGTIVERVVGRHLNEHRLDQLYAIGVDEVSYRKGQKYLTVIMDQLEGRPVWLDEGRSRETMAKFFAKLGEERTQLLRVVSMDMCAPYIEEVKAQAPWADIAFDPFHVVKLASEAVHTVRRTEARDNKGSAEATALKGSRWSLLKAPEHQTAKDKAKLAEVEQLNKRVYRAYLLKEELRALYKCSPRSAPRHLEAWLAWARRSRLAPFVKLAATLTKYREGILNAIRYGLTNGALESLNGRISMLKHRLFVSTLPPLLSPWSSCAAPTFQSVYPFDVEDVQN